MLYGNYIAIKEDKISTQKDEFEYLYKKANENDGVVEYGNDFVNCKIISAWIQ